MRKRLLDRWIGAAMALRARDTGVSPASGAEGRMQVGLASPVLRSRSGRSQRSTIVVQLELGMAVSCFGCWARRRCQLA